ncbi:unnamed protein product [Symbiodinium sp. CCMP2456]|nr:unnamed protein product [Symbiodinium sp. CCMP2456]
MGASSSRAPPPHAAALQLQAGCDVGTVGKYASVCHVHGMAVAVPNRAQKVLAVDPARDQTSTIDLPVGIDASRSYKFSSVCYVKEVLVAVPLDAEKILVLNPLTGQSQSIGLPSGMEASMPCKFGSVCSVNGRAVAAPSGAEKILVVDPEDGHVWGIELPVGIDASKCCKYRSVCNVNGKAVMAPCNAEKILVVDPEASQAWAIDLPFGVDARAEWKYFSVCSLMGRAVAVPLDAEKILVVDPATCLAQAIHLPAGIDASRCDKYCSVSVVSGRAVAVPWNAKKILVVDPATGQALAIDLPTGIDASRARKFLCACAVNGKAVAVPSGAEKVLVVDAANGQASALDLPAGVDASRPRKYESVCSMKGRAVAVPFDAEMVLVVDPTAGKASAIDLPASMPSCSMNGTIFVEQTLGMRLSTDCLNPTLHHSNIHCLPIYAELLAALLSCWVHTDEREPPQIEYAAMHVHRLIQPAGVGSTVNFATVTAELPTGNVLYVVLKSNFCILDFLSWNLELDHTMTQDPDFFIHAGAARAVQDALFWLEHNLLERLKEAKKNRTWRIIFTGHSSGGMYAAVLLFLFWKKMGSTDVGCLLCNFDVQCVTFGSPMVFGGGSQQAQDFKAFAQKRAVNYINGNDPCPRAWGAINLRRFVEVAVQSAESGLVDDLRSIDGLVASQAVTAAARQLLSRPDFHFMEDVAKRYQHFAELRVLSPQSQFSHWRGFCHAPDSLRDHSMLAYMSRLFDAFSADSSECYVHSQTARVEQSRKVSVRTGGKAYFESATAVAVPRNAEKISVVDPATGQASAIELPTGIDASRREKFVSVCNVNGKAVAVPAHAEKILVVDPANGQALAIDLPEGIDAGRAGKFRSVCNVNGKAVAAPYDAEKILVVDPAAGRASAIDLPAGIDASRTSKFVSVFSMNGKAVAAPYDAEKILVVDPATGQVSAIDLPTGIDPSRRGKFVSVFNMNVKAIVVPYHGEKILVVDLANGQASAIDLPAGIDASREGKYLSVCNVNGKAVSVPAHAEKVVVVDPATGHASAIDLPESIDASRVDKFWSVCNVSDKAVAVPVGAAAILVVDPLAGQASAIDLPKGIDASREYKYVSVCNVNGKAVAVPFSAEKTLVVELPPSKAGQLNLSLQQSTVQQTPVFAELVAALLSYWVYTDEPEPPQLDHASMQVHRVIQPGEFGSSVKIARVTADLPTGKVMYVVFKGTSYILDFLNWNLELNHAMTQDPDFFVHGGAASTLHAASFWLEQGLLKHLEEASGNGVRRVILTGHSLGGMYAEVLLYLLWKKMESPSQTSKDVVSFLSDLDMRCVTFGSPMVFGGGSQQAQEFKAFAQQRAVNYINENDPCPRAWGAVDLRPFVEVAAHSVQNGLVDEFGSVKGFVASQALAAAAQQVLNRPDFQLLEEFAGRYQHFAELKVLSSERRAARWNEFLLTPTSLGDHTMLAYVNRLFDAFDDSRPECHIHSQIARVEQSRDLPERRGGKATTIDLPAGIDARGFRKFGSVCNVNGKAVAAPYDAEKALMVDPATGHASAIDLPAGIDASRSAKFWSMSDVNGKAVAVPWNDDVGTVGKSAVVCTSKILVVDPGTGQASAIDLPAGIDARTIVKFVSACNVNGKAVAASAIDLPAGINASRTYQAKYWSVCNVNGKAVVVPLGLHQSTVQETSVFAELVAAVLSYWVYTDEPEPPELDHASMQVHRVIQPGEFGSAVKIATVTADLPTGQVLYVVFKGTSYMLDFLNWNLELNHAMTQDPDFFVHSGAAGTIQSASFWLEQTFLARLGEARENGVRRVVFTGHSLGGMHAALLLYLFWKKMDDAARDVVSVLSGFDVWCVTFGSPMVFGGGSRQAQELKDFAQGRAVNYFYFYENDPCPRAWGAVNLRRFVEVAAKSVQNGLVDELGSVKGFVASRPWLEQRSKY